MLFFCVCCAFPPHDSSDDYYELLSRFCLLFIIVLFLKLVNLNHNNKNNKYKYNFKTLTVILIKVYKIWCMHSRKKSCNKRINHLLATYLLNCSICELIIRGVHGKDFTLEGVPDCRMFESPKSRTLPLKRKTSFKPKNNWGIENFSPLITMLT